MKRSFSNIISKLEIVIASVLFFTMLVSCGLYIDIRMNGKTSSLPPVSERDKSVILRSVASESVTYTDDLIEPVFVGFKQGGEMIAAYPKKETRAVFESMLYNAMYQIFLGEARELDTEDNLNEIEKIKNSDRFLLVSFYDDVASSVFIPCLSQGYETASTDVFFDVKHLFFVPDEEDNLCGVAVSSDQKIFVIEPKEQIKFNKIMVNSYDVNDGYSYFEFYGNEEGSVLPVLTSSFGASAYQIESLSLLYGKKRESGWIESLLDTFTMNHNLVRNYSAKNGTEMNYIDELYELKVSDGGKVVFDMSDGDGIALNEYLGYLPENNLSYTYYDKIFAVKNLVNRLIFEDSDHFYTICGVDYDETDDTLSVYLKATVDGILLDGDRYDSLFKIKSNHLVYAEFDSIVCRRLDEKKSLIPQSYASVLLEQDGFDNASTLCACLTDSRDGIYFPEWVCVREGEE